MNSKSELAHLLGNFKDKREVLASVSQPLLTSMIHELIKFPYNRHDHQHTISALDLWEECLLNPELSFANFQTLAPQIFRTPGYPVRYIESHSPKMLIQKLLSHNFSDSELSQILVLVLSPNYQAYKMPNKLLTQFIKQIQQNSQLINCHQILTEYKTQILQKCPPDVLLLSKSLVRRSSYFHSLYVFNISKQEIDQEIKNRKHKTPKPWKKYTAQHFVNFNKSLRTLLVSALINRRVFFKSLKNRLLSPAEINQSSQKYIQFLDQMIDLIHQEKQLIKDRSALDTDSTPDPSAVSDSLKT